MTTVLEEQDTATAWTLYMALELNHKKWKLGFSDGERNRQNTIEAGDRVGLNEMIQRVKAKFNRAEACRVGRGYEAGRDEFWTHRALEALGIENLVVDSSSIEVDIDWVPTLQNRLTNVGMERVFTVPKAIQHDGSGSAG